MQKIYYLKTCSTCQRILKRLHLVIKSFEIKNIKIELITEAELEQMKRISGSYESLFSRRSQSYKKLGLKDKSLLESDYKSLILEDYTFLKRPVIIDEDKIFIGSEKSNIEALFEHFKIEI